MAGTAIVSCSFTSVSYVEPVRRGVLEWPCCVRSCDRRAKPANPQAAKHAQVPEAGVTQTEFEQGNKAVFKTSGPTSGPDRKSEADFKLQAIVDLNRAIDNWNAWQGVTNTQRSDSLIKELKRVVERLQDSK